MVFSIGAARVTIFARLSYLIRTGYNILTFDATSDAL